MAIPELVPVFPLPDTVLLPGALLPLHIFEPRYRLMIADTLRDHQALAIALLEDGFEPFYYTSHAPIRPIIGVGVIVSHERIDDGRYNILVRGLARARIVEEFADKPYRVARVAELSDGTAADDFTARLKAQRARKRLRSAMQAGPAPTEETRWLALLEDDDAFGEAVDAIAAEMSMPGRTRQWILETPDLADRSAILVKHLEVLQALRRTQHERYLRRGASTN